MAFSTAKLIELIKSRFRLLNYSNLLESKTNEMFTDMLDSFPNKIDEPKADLVDGQVPESQLPVAYTGDFSEIEAHLDAIDVDNITINNRIDGVETDLTVIQAEQIVQNDNISAHEIHLTSIDDEQTTQNNRLDSLEDNDLLQDGQIEALIAGLLSKINLMNGVTVYTDGLKMLIREGVVAGGSGACTFNLTNEDTPGGTARFATFYKAFAVSTGAVASADQLSFAKLTNAPGDRKTCTFTFARGRVLTIVPSILAPQATLAYEPNGTAVYLIAVGV